jgi:hypothetical protein
MRNLRLVHSNTWLTEPSTDASAVERPNDGADAEIPPLDPAVQAMVEHVRMIVPLPRAIRARALARARAAIATAAIF